jgi:uncharacterized membrane protein YfcA
MALQERLARFAVSHRLSAPEGGKVPLPLHAAVFALSVYGAYFGAGLGILTLALLAILLPDDLQRSNALKGVLSLIINFIAVMYFSAFGPVAWLPAAIMAVGAVAGGYLGVGLARRLGRKWLRIAVISYGLVATVVLFAKL